MRYGLIEELEEFEAYILGKSKMPFIPYVETGSWEEFLPELEKQRTKDFTETSACTAFASLNQAETFIRGVYGYEANYSERFTYLLAGITPQKGVDPQVTHEVVRKNGLIDERLLPMTRTIAEYIDRSVLTGSLLAKGLYWLQEHDYQHEWVWTTGNRPTNYIEILREALKTSPIAVSVSAWNKVDGVYVSDQGSVNNHYCLLYKIDDEGYPWIFDSYDNSKKKLAKDHNIRRAKRIHIQKRTKPAMRKHVSILQAIVDFFLKKKS